MTQVNRWLICAATIMAAMMLVSCVAPNYIPDKNTVKHMNVWKARHIVEADLQHGVRVGGRHGILEPISSTRITPNEITLLTEDGQSVVIPFKDVKISAYGKSTIVIEDRTLDIKIALRDIPPHNTKDLANALFVLTRSGSELRAMEDVELHFDDTAKAYREASPKPSLPEEARRFKVQAEGAVNDKQFESAADYYEQAIEVAPWWPEGHFNRALVLGETKEYDLAIIEMKRYLLLIPNAPDARAAQDKIYDWERKAGKSN